MQTRVARRIATAVAVCALSVTGCTADPPPPIESTDSPNPPTAIATRNTVVVAIDDVGVGFNPHLLADQSPTNSAVAALVLPSPFRPVVGEGGPGTTQWNLDPTVMVSADVTSQDPFTITYQIRNEAQWSDGAPIAAEDFLYLWQQMIKEPGTVDPAGYGRIRDVGSSGGGKTVTVTMDSPYPAWRELFTNLLPAHLVKDSPGGFARGLAESIPVSGGHFHIKSIDRGRDEVVLERNDRFWDAPAKPDQILMRRAGAPAQLADSIRSDDAQIAVIHGGNAVAAQLSAIPEVRTETIFQPRVLQLALNARAGELTDVRVRAGVLGMLDPALLATVGAGSRATVEPARAQILSPSDAGYTPTAPPQLDRDQAFALLASAGYIRQDAAPASTSPVPGEIPPGVGRITKDGDALTLRIGTPEEDDVAAAVASTVVDQLRAAGIDASTVRLPASDLYGDALVDREIDAIVGWVRSGSDRATALASRFGCSSTTTPGAPSTPGPDTTPTPPAPQEAPNSRAPSNLSGACDPALQPVIDSTLRGPADIVAVAAQLEPKLWELSTVLPILQDTTVVAAGSGVEGVSLTGAIQVGIFADADSWSRRDG